MKNPSEKEIGEFAYELYLRHGKTGDVDQYRMQAEWELKQMLDRDETGTAIWVQKPTRKGGSGTSFAVVNSGRTLESN